MSYRFLSRCPKASASDNPPSPNGNCNTTHRQTLSTSLRVILESQWILCLIVTWYLILSPLQLLNVAPGNEDCMKESNAENFSLVSHHSANIGSGIPPVQHQTDKTYIYATSRKTRQNLKKYVTCVLLPSRNSCSDNWSSNLTSSSGNGGTRVLTLCSLPRNLAMLCTISGDKLISDAEAVSGVIESETPIQTSRSPSKLLGCVGTLNSHCCIIWQKFSNSSLLTSLGLT